MEEQMTEGEIQEENALVRDENSDTPVFDASKLDKKSREILEETEDDDFKFKLNDFEGPLDLLLHLVKITKIDIHDIFVSDIIEQYLELMKNIDEVDVDKACEFINMSATLLEIKSKSLLPKLEEEDAEEEDPRERLIRQMEEHELFKKQCEKLEKLEDVDKFYKAPDDSVGEFKYELPEKLSVKAMIEAFSNLMQKMTIKAEAVQEKKIEKDKFTVANKISQIKDKLLEEKSFKFTDLFEDTFTRSEMINTFLALLELLKRQYITVEQNGLFDEIEIVRNDDESARLTDDMTLDYDGEK